ncbi:MAG: DoxX family protein [Verrucomicrobia bacterium]|nr:DoxX family protein [Verrucomicrobiota bacterium]
MKTKVLNVLTILFGLLMLNSGLNKFFWYMPEPEMSEAQMAAFEGLMTVGWVLPLVAIVEIVGGILIAVPKYRALGAIVILPVMVGIFLEHMSHAPETIIVPIILFVINLWAIIDNKEKYMPMVR